MAKKLKSEAYILMLPYSNSLITTLSILTAENY